MTVIVVMPFEERCTVGLGILSKLPGQSGRDLKVQKCDSECGQSLFTRDGRATRSPPTSSKGYARRRSRLADPIPPAASPIPPALTPESAYRGVRCSREGGEEAKLGTGVANLGRRGRELGFSLRDLMELPV